MSPALAGRLLSTVPPGKSLLLLLNSSKNHLNLAVYLSAAATLLLSHLTLSDPMQYARLLCSSPSPGACSKSYPLSWWCHPTISSSVVPFSSWLQSFPASGSFLMSHLFAAGGQGIVASGSASVLPMNIKDWFPLGLTGLISLQSKGLSRDFSNTIVQNINSLKLSLLYSPALTSIHDCWKNHSFD